MDDANLAELLNDMWMKHARLACLALDKVTAAVERLDDDTLTVGDLVKLAGMVNDLERVPGGSAFKPLSSASCCFPDDEEEDEGMGSVIASAGPVRFYIPVNGRENPPIGKGVSGNGNDFLPP